MSHIFNFSSGPAMLPSDVLKQIQREFRNWNGLGTSVIEISHRSDDFVCLVKEAKKNLSDLLNVPSNYKILFCHGGGRGQFSAVPLNLLSNKTKADYIKTGYWSEAAAKEAKKYCAPNIVNAEFIIDGKYGVKPMNEWRLSYDSAYMHYCPNETIDGIAIYESPSFSSEMIITADFSSCILSSPLDISSFGVIYASAQKNIGPSGLTLVIIRDDLLGMSSRFCPSILNYTVLSENESMYNTPSTFSLYVANLLFNWLKKRGGVVEISVINQQKAMLLYDAIDNSELYQNNVIKKNRSRMNVPFHLTNKKLEDIFLRESFDAGLYALRGHRVVGGMRASIYNAMPLEGVKKLVEFMIDFECRYG